MHPAVVFGLDPRHEQPVELQQRSSVVDPGGGEVLAAGVGDLDEELLTHGAGRVGRAARCQRVLVLFRAASHRTGRARFRASGSPVKCYVSGAAVCPWIRSWQSPQTTRDLRRR
jgi:hypothetical protein